MNILRLILFIKVQHIILYPFQRLLLCNCIHKSMLYYTFIWLRQDFLLYLHKSLLCHTMELKDVMKQRREILSLTQQDLAEMAQVGLATIKDIERGKGNPALNTVKKILEVLGIEIDYKVRQTI